MSKRLALLTDRLASVDHLSRHAKDLEDQIDTIELGIFRTMPFLHTSAKVSSK